VPQQTLNLNEQPRVGSGQSKRSLGGRVSKEFEKETKAKIDEAYSLMESQQEQLEKVEKELGHLKSDVAMKFS
jgi:hypothetical protein